MSGRGVEEVAALRVGARQVVLDVEADDVAAGQELGRHLAVADGPQERQVVAVALERARGLGEVREADDVAARNRRRRAAPRLAR
jgi:hypothetical protein